MSLTIGHYRAVLGTYLGPQRGRVALLAALLLASIALQLINPQVIRAFIDATQTGAPPAVLLRAAALFIGLAVVQRLAALGALYHGERIGWQATNALRADLTRHLLRLDMGFHKRRTPGELIERVDGDVSSLGNFFSRFSLELAGNTILVLGVLALLFREDWRVGLGLSAYAALVFTVLIALQRVASDRWAKANQAHAEQFGFLEEHIGGAEDIRASGAERYVLGRLATLGHSRMHAELRALMASNLTFVITNFLSIVGYALGLAIGVWLYTRGEATIGTAFLIVFYIGMLADPLEHIRAQVEDLQQAGAGLGRVTELLAIRPLVREREQVNALPPGALGVTFEHVSFAYNDDDRLTTKDQGRTTDDDRPRTTDHGPRTTDQRPRTEDGLTAADERRTTTGQLTNDDERPRTDDERRTTTDHGPRTDDRLVLRDVSFTLTPGTVLGLLGRTGSGKSTLTRLIFRLYDPDSGTVRIGSQDLRDVALDDRSTDPGQSLRARVGMVTQEVQIFQASVRDNLVLFNRRIDDSHILLALDELGLREWAEALPEGLDTRLGAGGRGLSAGEAQLLAFTRVFLRDPGLVILDEASSRLDPATERLLERAIGRLLNGRTGIIIAHRLRTVQRANEILILEQGQIIEHGARVTLAADPGSRFAGLLRTGLEEALA